MPCTYALVHVHVHVVGTVHVWCTPPRPVHARPSRPERRPAVTQVAGTAYALLGGYARASRSWTPGASDSLFRYTGPKGCRVRALRSGAGVAAAAAAARDADVLVASAETLEGAGLSELLMRSAVVVAVDEADASLRGAGGGACARCLEVAGAPTGSGDGVAEGGGNRGGGGEGGGAVRLLVGATLSESLVAQAVAQRWLSAPLTLADGDGRAAEWAPPAGKGGSVGRRVDVDVVDVVRGRGVGGVGDGVVLGGNDGEVLGVVLASAGGAGGAGSADGVVLGGDGGEVLGVVLDGVDGAGAAELGGDGDGDGDGDDGTEWAGVLPASIAHRAAVGASEGERLVLLGRLLRTDLRAWEATAEAAAVELEGEGEGEGAGEGNSEAAEEAGAAASAAAVRLARPRVLVFCEDETRAAAAAARLRTALWGDHAVGVLLPTRGQQPSLVADTFRRGDGASPPAAAPPDAGPLGGGAAFAEAARDARASVLVAPVSAARGLDFANVSHVYALADAATPAAADYVHLAGRTGRVGQRGGRGVVTSLLGSAAAVARLQAVVAALGGSPLSVLASAAPELERLTGAAPATFELAEEATLDDSRRRLDDGLALLEADEPGGS